MTKKEKDAIKEAFLKKFEGVPVIIRGTNWKMTLDEYTEQESWLRKIPDVGRIGGGYFENES